MAHHDNWGWRARVGMFIVSSEAVPEAEWWAMCPADVSVHAARVTASTPWAVWREGRAGVALEEDLARGARQFAAMRLSAVVLGHSSSSIAGGRGWDDATAQGLSEILGSGVAVTTNGLDCAAGLTACQVKRPFLVFPPWFGDDTLALGMDYFRDSGFDPPAYLRHDPGPGWRDVPPRDLYAHGMGFAQDVVALYAQVRAACPDTADGVLMVGTGLRCVGVIDALEQSLGRPVVSANQASLWRCLRLSGVRTPVPGYGTLLQL